MNRLQIFIFALLFSSNVLAVNVPLYTNWNSAVMISDSAPAPVIISASSEATPAWQAVDDNYLTWWQPTGSFNLPQWWKYDCGLGHSNVCMQLGIRNQLDFGIQDFILQGSLDDIKYATLIAGTCVNVAYTLQTFTNTTPLVYYRYFKLIVNTGYDVTYGMLLVPEISLSSAIPFPNMTTDVLPVPYVASASSELSSSYDASKVFDGDVFTYWSAAAEAVAPHWLKFDCGSKVCVSAFTLRNYLNSGIGSFIFSGSLDDVSWTPLLTAVAANDATVQRFTFANTAAYRYYKLAMVWGYGSTPTVYDVVLYRYLTTLGTAAPLAWYKMNGADIDSTNNLLDSSGNGYTITNMNGVVHTATGCLFTAASSQYFQTSGMPQMTNNSFTVTGWFLCNDAAAWHCILHGGNDGGRRWYTAIQSSSGVLQGDMKGDIEHLVQTASSCVGAWHHFAYSVDRDGFSKLWLDNTFAASGDVSAVTGGVSSPGDFFRVGNDKDALGAYFDGMLKDIRIFDCLIPANQREIIYYDVAGWPKIVWPVTWYSAGGNNYYGFMASTNVALPVRLYPVFESVSETALDTPIVVTVDSEYASIYAGWEVFDQDLQTRWAGGDGSSYPHWLKYDCGAGVSNVWQTITLTPFVYAGDPYGFSNLTVDTSMDNITWTVGGTHVAAGIWSCITNTDTPVYARYIRVAGTVGQQAGMSYMEMSMSSADYESPRMTASNSPSPYNVSCDSIFNSDYDCYFAHDKRVIFYDGYGGFFSTSGSTWPHWIAFDFGTNTIINGFTLLPYTDRNFKNFECWGSLDNNTWVTLSAHTATSSNLKQTFTNNNVTAYRWYKLYGTAGYDATSLGIRELVWKHYR